MSPLPSGQGSRDDRGSDPEAMCADEEHVAGSDHVPVVDQEPGTIDALEVLRGELLARAPDAEMAGADERVVGDGHVGLAGHSADDHGIAGEREAWARTL